MPESELLGTFLDLLRPRSECRGPQDLLQGVRHAPSSQRLVVSAAGQEVVGSDSGLEERGLRGGRKQQVQVFETEGEWGLVDVASDCHNHVPMLCFSD